MKYKILKYKYNSNNSYLRIEWFAGWFLRLFGFKSHIKQYLGNATVWREYNNNKNRWESCMTNTEAFLSDVQFTENRIINDKSR